MIKNDGSNSKEDEEHEMLGGTRFREEGIKDSVKESKESQEELKDHSEEINA